MRRRFETGNAAAPMLVERTSAPQATGCGGKETERTRTGSTAKAWGMLAALDLRDCSRERVADAECLRGFVQELVPAIGMRAHGPTHLERFGSGDLQGWSAMQFIETSSVTIHADEVDCRCFVDVFSCKSFDPRVAAAIAERWFGGTARWTVLQRGAGGV